MTVGGNTTAFPSKWSVWGTGEEIRYWWCVRDVLLIGWSGGTTNRRSYPDRGIDTYQCDIFGACSSDVVVSRGNQWWLVRAWELPAREGMLLAAIHSSCDFTLPPLISREWRESRANRDTHSWRPSSSVACMAGVERVREGGEKEWGFEREEKGPLPFPFCLFSPLHFPFCACHACLLHSRF